ncbi:MAG: chorismate mutase [Kiritimatiellae bacterium]|nr:chorismate mutase [Kiritimatiellia bacterium]
MRVARRIARVQKQHGLSIFQPERWRATLERLQAEGAAVGLDREFMAELYQLVHEETLRQKSSAAAEDNGDAAATGS